LKHEDALSLGFGARLIDHLGIDVEGIHSAVDDPCKRHREVTVAAAQIEGCMSAVTPRARSKLDGSGHNAAHQSRSGIELAANMLAMRDSCG
jgi:hypothetical protein